MADTKPAAAPAAKPVAPTITTPLTIDLPEQRSARGGAASIYPFDSLEVGQVFGVKGRDKRSISSAISNANRKYKVALKDAEGNPVFETKTLTGADGSVTNIPDTSKPKTVAGRHFVAIETKGNAEVLAAIKGTALEGSDVLVKRDK